MNTNINEVDTLKNARRKKSLKGLQKIPESLNLHNSN